MQSNPTGKPMLNLVAVDASNWRKVIRVKVSPSQQDFVAEPSYYLLLCQYGELWQPLAIMLDEQVIGFIMWAIDPEDGSCWLGGFQLDKDWQRQGYGRLAIQNAIKMLSVQQEVNRFALSVQPENPARALYTSLGFVETEDWEDDEVVLRLTLEQ